MDFFIEGFPDNKATKSIIQIKVKRDLSLYEVFSQELLDKIKNVRSSIKMNGRMLDLS